MTSTVHRDELDRHGPEADRPRPRQAEDFCHEAFFYGDAGEFLDGTAGFVEEGVRAGEPVMVALPRQRLELLRDALGPSASGVVFADMADIGRNPARIIPAWRRFVDEHLRPGRPVRGIGEPIWSERAADELAECQLHEVLLNVAFAGGPPWRLLCPYDTVSLDPAVLAEARRSHPYLHEAGTPRGSDSFDGRGGPELFSGSFPDPPPERLEKHFDTASLPSVREAVGAWATPQLPAGHVRDFVLAVHEVATNSVRHGGGAGVLRCWSDGAAVVCEVCDGGSLTPDDLVGRVAPPADREFGRGLWLANQLCDLVQLRTSPGGTAVRLHISAG